MDWERNLRSLDSNEGLRNTLDKMCLSYLQSHFADDHNERQEVLVLYLTLKQLF